MTASHPRLRRDDGFETLEAVLMVPALLAVILLVVLAGRTMVANGELQGAARAAARAASQAGSAADARQRAMRAATVSLQNSSTACAGGPAVTLEAGQFHAGGSVTVRVTCTVRRGDLGVGTAKTVSASATEVIDTYRGDR